MIYQVTLDQINHEIFTGLIKKKSVFFLLYQCIIWINSKENEAICLNNLEDVIYYVSREKKIGKYRKKKSLSSWSINLFSVRLVRRSLDLTDRQTFVFLFFFIFSLITLHHSIKTMVIVFLLHSRRP